MHVAIVCTGGTTLAAVRLVLLAMHTYKVVPARSVLPLEEWP